MSGQQNVQGDGGEQREAGLQDPNTPNAAQAGDDAAAKADEPKVKVGDKEYPLSAVENGLKLHENFTVNREEELKRQRELDEREAKVAQQSAMLEPVSVMANLLRDPSRAEALAELAPELGDLRERALGLQQTANEVEKLGLMFDVWAAKSADFDDDQKRAVGTAAYKAIQDQIAAGRLDPKSIDFDAIGTSLFREQIVQREAERIAADKAAKEKRERDAHTAPPGAPALSGDVDLSKLSGRAKIAEGRRLAREAARK